MPRARQGRSSAAGKLPVLPRFSPTRIALYLFCPRAYHFYYRQKLRWGGRTAGHVFGGGLHRTLQAFHDRGGAGQVSLDELLSDLRERLPQESFASAEEAAALLAAGEAALEQYYRADAEPGRETVWTEKTLKHRYERFVLWGRIDRLDRRPDGSLEVIDYKSGRRETSEEEVRESLALKIYQLLVARQHPGVPVHAGILSIRTGHRASILRTAEELEEVERGVIETVDAILQDEVMPALPGPQCRSCDYPRICAPGRRWLREHRDV